MKVPLLDLRAQLQTLREEIIAEVSQVIDSTQYILGAKVQALEDAVAIYSNCRYGIGVSSGTDALLVALMALDIGPGDSVVTTPFSFFATAGVISRVGARPVFVDIDPETYNLDPEKLDALFKRHPELCEKTKVIIPVHLYGQCAEMKSIAEIAGRYGIQIIEDAAQAIGADYPWKETKEGSTGEIVWKRSGSMGILGCFSFFPSKNLGGIGDGGMVVTNDEGMAEKMKILRVHGSKPKYYHRLIGGNFRLDPVQAAVLSVKLPYLEGWHQRRRENATTYDSLFSEAGLTGEGVVRLPQAAYGKYVAQGKPVNSHIYNQYTIRVKDRGRLREFLKGAGIDTEIYYPVPLHLQECYAGLGYTAGDFPEAERAASEVLALPIYPELTREMQAYVVEKVREFYD